MSIETYATTMIRLYRGLFMLAIFMGIVTFIPFLPFTAWLFHI